MAEAKPLASVQGFCRALLEYPLLRIVNDFVLVFSVHFSLKFLPEAGEYARNQLVNFIEISSSSQGLGGIFHDAGLLR
jgi:hypothetical protein